MGAIQEPAIATRGLTKLYGRSRGILDLDLEVRRGEVFGLLGPNGAGKTTTIRLLLGLIRPTRGEAKVFGLDSRQGAVEIHSRTGYLPASFAILGDLTGAQLLGFLGGMRGKARWPEVERLAERLACDLSRRIGALSSGNRQKVGLIQAWMHHPDLLILDEPSNGLDPLVQHTLHDMIAEAAAGGATVLLSSHILSEVERIADRVGIIREGRLVAVEEVGSLKHKAVRRVEVHLGAPPPPDLLAGVPGVGEIAVRASTLRLAVAGSMDPLVKALAAVEVTSLVTHEADLEEIFLNYYRGDGTGA